MTYVKINDVVYPANIDGRIVDREWNDRESKTITLGMTHEVAETLFVDGAAWSIIDEVERRQEDGSIILVQEEYDNSEYSIAGSITDNRDGTLAVKMGKPTQLEAMQAQLANAVTQTELETAYTEGVNSL